MMVPAVHDGAPPPKKKMLISTVSNSHLARCLLNPSTIPATAKRYPQGPTWSISISSASMAWLWAYRAMLRITLVSWAASRPLGAGDRGGMVAC
jgi:hypothetical protein